MSASTEDKSMVINKLMPLFLPRVDYLPDKSFLFTFLLSSRMYILPNKLLDKLSVHLTTNEAAVPSEKKRDFIYKFVQVLHEWTNHFPYDFLNQTMLTDLKNMCLTLVELEPSIKPDVDHLSHELSVKLQSLWVYEMQLHSFHTELVSRLQSPPNMESIIELCPDPKLLAQQLVCVELNGMRHIALQQFMHASVKNGKVKWHNSEQIYGLEWYIHWFNRLSVLIATEICQHSQRHTRVRLVDYFIDVAMECCNLGNFNSCMALISGLSMNQVSRLKKTWSRASNAHKFEGLQRLIDPSCNFVAYRTTLRAAVSRAQGAATTCEKIIIPFFSLFLKDLFFLNEAKDMLTPASRFSDFKKCWALASKLVEFNIWKSLQCPFQSCHDIVRHLYCTPVFSDEALTLASFSVEQPDNSYDKSYQKQLKK